MVCSVGEYRVQVDDVHALVDAACAMTGLMCFVRVVSKMSQLELFAYGAGVIQISGEELSVAKVSMSAS